MALSRFFEKTETVVMPSSIKTDPDGFEFFASLLKQTARRQTFILDFKNVVWIEANLCAVLGCIIHYGKESGNSFEIINLPKDGYIKNTITNNGFMTLVLNSPRPKRRSTGILFRSFDMKNEDEVEAYIYEYVLNSKRVPRMTALAKKKVYRSIFEIYQNSVMHSKADRIFVCGQYYPGKGKMALTMVELGRSFKDNVSQHDPRFKDYSGCEAIEWAVETGNTTKPKNETGGLGLDLIRDFLKMNEGKL